MYIENDDRADALEALSQRIARTTEPGEMHTTAIQGLSPFRRQEPSEPVTALYEPSICLIAQGAKRVHLRDDIYVRPPSLSDRLLIASVHLPTVVQVIEASEEKPYLGLRLKFDLNEVSQLMADSHLPPARIQQSSRGMATGEVMAPLVNAFLRLIELLDTEQDIPMRPAPRKAQGERLVEAGKEHRPQLSGG